MLCLDADERVTPEQQTAIENALQNPSTAAFRFPRRNRFLGRYLKHGEGYPDWSLRLFNRGQARWSDDTVHEKVETKSSVGELTGDLLHDSYFRNISTENPLGLKLDDKAVNDDIIAKTEMHFPVNTPIMLNINSRDIIHSVYMPHFRVQMNAVPGMTTNFYFKPTITTAEMRKKTANAKFDYVILCNKICGVSHYTMNMKVVVDSKEDFVKWLKTQPLAKPAPTADNANASQTVKEIAEAVK